MSVATVSFCRSLLNLSDVSLSKMFPCSPGHIEGCNARAKPIGQYNRVVTAIHQRISKSFVSTHKGNRVSAERPGGDIEYDQIVLNWWQILKQE